MNLRLLEDYCYLYGVPRGGQEGIAMLNGVTPLPLENSPAFSGGYLPPEKVNGIYDLIRQLVSTNTLDVLLNSIVQMTIDILRVKFCRILILEPDGRFLVQASSPQDTFDLNFGKWQRALPRAQEFLQRVVLNGSPIFIGQGSRLSTELRFALRLGCHDDLFLVPMRVDQEAVGILVLGEERQQIPESVLKEKFHLAILIADQAAGAIYRARLSNRLEESQVQTVLALAKVMESHDSYIGEHCRRVTDISVKLASKLNCSPQEMQSIRWAALLHDIGKMSIQDNILNKVDPLDKEDWDIIRRHPEKGAEIVRMASNMDYVAGLILAHHERFDGTGYPCGLKNEMIPFGARILAVADAFSAMTDERPYRPTKTIQEAVEEIKRCSGTQFDPHIVDAFIALCDEGSIKK